jgi:hypothetical protein
VESQVLSGVKFSNSDGQLRIGTMPNKEAITITPSGSTQTIPLEYHNGQGKVSAVTVPVANVLIWLGAFFTYKFKLFLLYYCITKFYHEVYLNQFAFYRNETFSKVEL